MNKTRERVIVPKIIYAYDAKLKNGVPLHISNQRLQKVWFSRRVSGRGIDLVYSSMIFSSKSSVILNVYFSKGLMKHYKHGIEPIEFIESHKMNFSEGNVVKYVTRYRYKDGKADLLKAEYYIKRLIAEYKDRE